MSYGGAAPYYRVGRMAYPPELVDALVRELGLDGTQRLLDVGCGPGSLTLLLAPHVASAVGVDADAGMLAEAARVSSDVRWVQLRAEDLPAGLGNFDVVSFAQSFHWLDAPAVAATVRGMLEPGGACVHVGATTHRGDEGSDPLHDAIEALIARYLGARPASDWIGGSEPAIFRAAGFTRRRRIELDVTPVVIRSEDELVAATFSLSFAAPHRFGERKDAFEADLRALLREVSPHGRFAERRRAITLDIWRT